MRYARHGGDFTIEQPGRLLVRAARLGRHLKWPALAALVATIVTTAARLLGPLAVRSGVDDGIQAGDKDRVTIAAIVFLALLIVQYLAAVVSQYTVTWVGERYLLTLRSSVFRHLVNLDAAFFDRQKTGVLVSRMTSDVESLTEFVNEGAVMLITNLLTALGVAVALVFVDTQLALLILVVIAVLVVISVVFQRFVSRAYKLVRERIGAVLASLQEGISGVRVVQAFTQQGEQLGTFARVNERFFDANMQAARAISWYFPSVSFLRIVGISIVLLVGGNRVIDGTMSFGSLVVFLLYLDWFFQPIVNLANVYNLAQAALAALAKLFDLLDTRPSVVERPGAYDLPEPLSGAIALNQVSFGYNENVEVLSDVDLEIPPGQRLAVVGETGAGKSTIAKLVMRFYDPTAGSITIDGHDLCDVTTDSRINRIALIPQDGYLFNGSLRDNLRYGKPDSTDDEIWNVAAAMGIAGWVRDLPERLDTPVRERGSRFSAGERQLVALARAFLADPSIIVLDEATSNLDPETEVRMENALRALLAGRTAVVIAHRLRSAERADRVVMVDAGRIIADGSHEELVVGSPEYGELVAVWQRGVA
ncbi:MAG: ABC transporter ATP-binding protein/permease [Acidimicrobiia bacterium]|nr:ABC transporter ATP-binding protein/permease [Acidimicrobiia bacterium]NNC74784.1 ABC transporter ATP-binding protein [Acidimicrobiia bacterium]